WRGGYGRGGGLCDRRTRWFIDVGFNGPCTRAFHKVLMLRLQQIVQVVFGKIGLPGLFGKGFGILAEATSLDEHLRLQQVVVLARLTLNVINGGAKLHVGIEPENHVAPEYTAAEIARRRLI